MLQKNVTGQATRVSTLKFHQVRLHFTGHRALIWMIFGGTVAAGLLLSSCGWRCRSNGLRRSASHRSIADRFPFLMLPTINLLPPTSGRTQPRRSGLRRRPRLVRFIIGAGSWERVLSLKLPACLVSVSDTKSAITGEFTNRGM